jgi:hypothetical protein
MRRRCNSGLSSNRNLIICMLCRGIYKLSIIGLSRIYINLKEIMLHLIKLSVIRRVSSYFSAVRK